MAVVCVTGTGLCFADDGVRLQRFGPNTTTGLSSAIRVSNADLVHTTQLLPGAVIATEADLQTADVLTSLGELLREFQSSGDDIVKLNVYVRDAEVRDAFATTLARWGESRLPSVSYVATPLPDERALVALDAVFVSRLPNAQRLPTLHRVARIAEEKRHSQAAVLPAGDVVYVAGQAEPGALVEATRATLDGLLKTLAHLALDRRHIVQVKCFLQPMSDVATVNEQMAAFFGDGLIPPVSYVEWISGSAPIEIELVAWASPGESSDTLSYATPPWMKSSPVFSRLSRIHGNDRIYTSGLYSELAGSGEEQVRAVFKQLRQVLDLSGSDLRHLAKATYYVSDADASRQLNQLRPEYYDPQRPPAASKATVADVAGKNRSLTLDMIAAPIR